MSIRCTAHMPVSSSDQIIHFPDNKDRPTAIHCLENKGIQIHVDKILIRCGVNIFI